MGGEKSRGNWRPGLCTKGCKMRGTLSCVSKCIRFSHFKPTKKRRRREGND